MVHNHQIVGHAVNPSRKDYIMKTMEINGEVFEVIRSKCTVGMIDHHGHDYLGRRSLYDFYANPSMDKRDIWSNWCDWAAWSYPQVSNMYVTSASSFSFTIGAYYCDSETYEIIGYIRITKDHNRLYLPR